MCDRSRDGGDKDASPEHALLQSVAAFQPADRASVHHERRHVCRALALPLRHTSKRSFIRSARTEAGSRARNLWCARRLSPDRTTKHVNAPMFSQYFPPVRRQELPDAGLHEVSWAQHVEQGAAAG